MNAMAYHVDITSLQSGLFKATDRATGWFVISPDPEHSWAHAMRDEPDGPVQFYRDGVPSLSHSSIHKMGQMRIRLGNSFPNERVKRSSYQGSSERPGAHGDSEGG